MEVENDNFNKNHLFSLNSKRNDGRSNLDLQEICKTNKINYSSCTKRCKEKYKFKFILRNPKSETTLLYVIINKYK